MKLQGWTRRSVQRDGEESRRRQEKREQIMEKVRIESRKGERKREGGRRLGVFQGGGMETVTVVSVVTSHTVWLSHAHSMGHRGRTQSTHSLIHSHTHTKLDSVPLIQSN